MCLTSGVNQLCEPALPESVRLANLPVDWKVANVCPIFRKRTRNNAGSDRPVSLTSVLSKTMDAIVKDRLIEFVEENEIISNAQHGFRKGKSCLRNLLESFGRWMDALDNGYGIDVIFLDYRKVSTLFCIIDYCSNSAASVFQTSM